ncbi:MAG: VanZ family protein [Clostridiaceae bacterium]|nr:VanZ family protein [Clostridiaceae bacterium]
MGVEVVQLIAMLLTFNRNRCFDIDDIIVNTLGGVIGFMFIKANYLKLLLLR